MFTVPPHDVFLEIGYELRGRREEITTLALTEVKMVALARLVVVANHASAVHDVGEPVFVTMLRAWHGPREFPDQDLGDLID
jgi:hypothetical protein